jgi:UDP-N-acetylmuramate dehydrogenase
MSLVEETYQRLRTLPELTVLRDAPLSRYTRFGIGGPADLYAETKDVDTFIDAMKIARSSGMDTVVIGGGTNLIVSDDGFRGLVLKFASEGIRAEETQIHVDAGTVLQTLVDYTIDRGLKGLETMTGIPGSVGAAVYGNAGAYGHSISERVTSVRFIDAGELREFDKSGLSCRRPWRLRRPTQPNCERLQTKSFPCATRNTRQR